MLNVIRFPLRFVGSRRARWVVAGVVLVGAVSGLANTALVAVINGMLARGGGITVCDGSSARWWSWQVRSDVS